MSPGPGYDHSEDEGPPKLSFGQHMLLVLPRMRRERREKEPVGDWMRKTFLKPEDPDAKRAAKPSDTPESVEELEALAKSINEKERAIGLLGAPFAALIGFLVVHALLAHDPTSAHLKNGAVNKAYVNPSTYHQLLLVLLALALVMLVTTMLRKRLFLGIATALYGLAIFNLHYWGFGIPFVMCGAWYLVRAYRLQRDLKFAKGEAPSRYGPKTQRSGSSYAAQPNKRYTPRSASSSTRAVQPKRAS